MAFSATFWVQGIPQPKGSMHAQLIGGRPMVIPNHDAKTRQWERAVKLVASRNAPPSPLDAPVSVAFRFVMPRPGKPMFDVPATKPDWDKLCRSTSDALTGVIWIDDSRVVRAMVSEEYGNPPGVEISVEEIELNPKQEKMFG